MKLITEVVQDVQYVTESAGNGNKRIFIEGKFMQADTKNRNGRLYPKPILEKELNRYQTLINEKRSLGELGHPPTPSVNLNNASHLITNLKFEGSDVIGKAKILDTPMGAIAKNLIEEGVRLGVSSRGLGSLKQNKQGINEVQDDFHLATVDIVSDPSGPECWVGGIMEGVDWLFVEGAGYMPYDQAKKRINRAYKKKDLQKREKELAEAFIKFFASIR